MEYRLGLSARIEPFHHSVSGSDYESVSPFSVSQRLPRYPTEPLNTRQLINEKISNDGRQPVNAQCSDVVRSHRNGAQLSGSNSAHSGVGLIPAFGPGRVGTRQREETGSDSLHSATNINRELRDEVESLRRGLERIQGVVGVGSEAPPPTYASQHRASSNTRI